MRSRHDMPFGASPVGDGAARFSLWAPSAPAVSLELAGEAGSPRLLPMARSADGFWTTIAEAGAGARYRYRVGGGLTVPDPASRFQPRGVHRASELVAPLDYEWRDAAWTGRPWHEAVIYELHVGTFTRAGRLGAMLGRLDALVDLGVTVLELMPMNAFSGRRGWGYDGVLPFAPHAAYGTPDELKQLVDACHERGLMIMLDVVYNHFGPDGNYLHAYVPEFFNARHQTPWGPAINLDGDHSATVREFFIHNALYWIEEYHFDGLRIDAVHALHDDSQPDFVVELAGRVRAASGQRQVHLVLENHDNESRYLAANGVRDGRATAQWNDDFHHALHVIVSGETDGYYADFAGDPVAMLGRSLAEGFAFQGEPSRFHGDAPRGEPSAHLPPPAFVSFLQTHDQVGNRAMGERLVALAPEEALRAATAILLLAPQVPLLFMGEEYGASTPFLYFCDFHDELGDAVRDGRRREFARFARFADPASRASIPDPNSPATFAASKLRFSERRGPDHRGWWALHRRLLDLRRRRIVPLLPYIEPGRAEYRCVGAGLTVRWALDDGRQLELQAQLSDQPGAERVDRDGERVFDSHPDSRQTTLCAWQVLLTLPSRRVGGP